MKIESITFTNICNAFFLCRKNASIFFLFFILISISTPLIFLPQLAYGHAFVTISDPSPSQSVASSPSKVDVFFSEPVDVKYSKLKVLDQNGKQINTNDLDYLNGDQSSLSAKMPQLKDGVYTVSTTVLSQTDGHVTDNAFVFAVGEAAVPSNVTHSNSQESNFYIPEAVARFPTLVGQVIIVGGAFSAYWLWRPIYRITGLSSWFYDIRKIMDKRMVSLFLIGSTILLISNFAILVIQASSISAAVMDVIATRFGMVVLARIILSLSLFSISIYEFRSYRKSPRILSKGETAGIMTQGIVLLLTTSFMGHGAVNNQFSSITLDFIHNLAASVWIGGVIYLGFILTPILRNYKQMKKEYKIALLSLIIPRFSLIVVTIFGFIVFTGPFLLYTLDNNLGQVLSSLYGKTLIVKLALAAIMVAFGSYNQLSIHKQAQSHTSIVISVTTKGTSKDTDDRTEPDFSNDNRRKWTKKKRGDLISKFSRVTKTESIVGILLLASVAFLVNTGVPFNESGGKAQDQPYINGISQQVEDRFRSTYFGENNSRIVLSIEPFTVGSNNFTISFVDSKNIPLDISSVTLKYTETEKSIGPITIDVQKVSKGIFSAKGAFGIPGLWSLQIEGVLNKPNAPALSGTFNDLRIKPKLDQMQFNITEFNTPSNATQPLYPIYDKTRNSIWVGDTAIDSGQLLEYRIDSNKYFQHHINDSSIITLLALDSKNEIWFVDPIAKHIGNYNPLTGKYQLFPLPKNIVPSGIAIDVNDSLWISSSTSGQVLIFDPKTDQIIKEINLEKGARPLSIAIDPVLGLAWVADERGKLVRIEPTNNYNMTVYIATRLNTTLKSPTGLLLDNVGGDIYISEHEGQRISVFNTITKIFQEYPPLDPKGLPFGMSLDKYGNLWVAEHTVNKIAVIDLQTGKSKEVKIPNPTPFVQWLTSDSDGNIWFAEQRGHALGLITSKASPSQIPSPAPTPSIAKANKGLDLIVNYDVLVAPAIVIGIGLVAFMYVKNLVDSRVGERLLIKYKNIGKS